MSPSSGSGDDVSTTAFLSPLDVLDDLDGLDEEDGDGDGGLDFRPCPRSLLFVALALPWR